MKENSVGRLLFLFCFGYLFDTFNTFLPTGGKIYIISLNEEKSIDKYTGDGLECKKITVPPFLVT